MILSCERCSARYAVDDGQLGSGRKVRCTSCGHSWFQAPEGAAPAGERRIAPEFQAAFDGSAPTPAADAPQPTVLSPEEQSRALRRFGATMSRKVEQPRDPVWRKRVVKGTVVALPTAALLAVAIGLRGELVEFWPPAARFFAAIGMPAPETAPGLAIRAVRMEEQTRDGHRTVIVEGELANTGTRTRKIPTLHASLGQGDATMARWSFAVGPAELGPGQVAQFHTQLADAPNGAHTVSVGLWR
ncbi:MAG TPA: zinc-ribbon domain-containing protein [Alphaproteobacteria bacterium]|nr:zinc-ribbon domain-containing protein [Alphaproteobacteria bacterium]